MKIETKFNIGDKVVITADKSYMTNEVGEISNIDIGVSLTEFNPSFITYRLRGCWFNELELSEYVEPFKAGDTIRHKIYKGGIASIIFLDEKGVLLEEQGVRFYRNVNALKDYERVES